MIKIGDKGFIACEVIGFGEQDVRLKLGRTLYVTARGHVIQVLEKEFIVETPPTPPEPSASPGTVATAAFVGDWSAYNRIQNADLLSPRAEATIKRALNPD